MKIVRAEDKQNPWSYRSVRVQKRMNVKESCVALYKAYVTLARFLFDEKTKRKTKLWDEKKCKYVEKNKKRYLDALDTIRKRFPLHTLLLYTIK